jgi:two-component system, OmpR family, phosphate regulon sensor histidine kinase PhoR
MRGVLRYNATLVAIAIGVIIISTGILSLVSYHYTAGRENLIETTLVQSNTKLATQYVDRIEQRIIDNDRILADMIDVYDPAKWPAAVESIKKADLNVDQVFIFRPGQSNPLFPKYSFEIRNSWGAVTASMKQREFATDKIGINQAHHLHKERRDNYFFASYLLKEDANGERYLICFLLNYERIIDLLDKYLKDLQPNFYVSIVDFDNNGIYGHPVSRASKYYYEMRFPTTFYKWILQIVPRNYTEIETDVRNQRRAYLFLIVMSMGLIFASLGIIYIGGRRERQLRKLKEDFISNVSHELKTPLSLINMFSEMLKSGRVRNETTKGEYYTIIHNESERMTHLIENLLDFASLERGERAKNFENVNLAQLVVHELEAFGYQAQKEGFHVESNIEESVSDTFADPTAISMALLNLLDNSLKYSGDRKQIRIGVGQKNGYIEISVSDQGPGIPADEQDRIFEKFYRGSTAAGKKIRGSGIGLSITRHVAEMHGGEILLQSEVGVGSTFTLRIPVRPVTSAAKEVAKG